MPIIRDRVTSTTTDALSNKKFNVIGGRGAFLNAWFSGATAGDAVGLSVGNNDVLVYAAPINVEASTYILDTDRDQVLFNEPVGPGQMYLPMTLTTAINYMIHILYRV